MEYIFDNKKLVKYLQKIYNDIRRNGKTWQANTLTDILSNAITQLRASGKNIGSEPVIQLIDALQPYGLNLDLEELYENTITSYDKDFKWNNL